MIKFHTWISSIRIIVTKSNVLGELCYSIKKKEDYVKMSIIKR